MESPDAVGDAAPARRARAGSRLKRVAEAYALVAALLLLVGFFGVLRPATFLSWANISTMLGSQAVLVVLTMGLLFPLTAGDLDLSMASTLTLSTMTIAILNVQFGVPLALCMIVSLLIGAAVGLVNAGFILFFRIPSLIVTLGTGSFINGLVLWMSGSMTISGIDDSLSDYTIIDRLFGIPYAFYFALLLCLVSFYFFSYTTPGRRVLFVGRGREVARLSGIRVDRVRLSCLMASSTIGAAAGIMYAGMSAAADPTSGLSFMLPAFAAAFLGATSIVPGRFNPIGSLVAVYFLVVGITGLTIIGFQSYVQNLFYGGGLVVAVALSQLVRKREAQDFT